MTIMRILQFALVSVIGTSIALMVINRIPALKAFINP